MMIWTIVKLNAHRLIHNRSELMLMFVVPIAFFSVFALIFGRGVNTKSSSKIKVIAVDEINNDASAHVVDSLRESVGLRFMPIPEAETLDRAAARELVRRGAVSMAIVVKGDPDETGTIRAELLSDASDQIASQVAAALVARSIMLTEAEAQQEQFRFFSKAPKQRDPPTQQVSPGPFRVASSSTASDRMRGDEPSSTPSLVSDHSKVQLKQSSSIADLPIDEFAEVDPVEIVDVMGQGKANPVVSMYAAGIAVMFLLFGATGGGGALLEERENRTLDRLLSTQMTMDHLLLGKWFYMTCVGLIQVTAMFVWAQVVFGVDLLGHFDGFVVMTLVTSAAASAFGLLLATLCRTRGQLNGLSVILILTMSALGGSMVPRYVMSESMRNFGRWTFNSWALDGYDKVFWRDLPASDLMLQFIVLAIAGAAFMVSARLLAYRWETN